MMKLTTNRRCANISALMTSINAQNPVQYFAHLRKAGRSNQRYYRSGKVSRRRKKDFQSRNSRASSGEYAQTLRTTTTRRHYRGSRSGKSRTGTNRSGRRTAIGRGSAGAGKRCDQTPASAQSGKKTGSEESTERGERVDRAPFQMEALPPVLVSFIAAGAGAATYILFGTMAVVENGRLKDKCLPGPTCSKDEVSNLRTYSLVADIGLTVALVGGAVGTVLLLTSGKKEEKPVAVAPWVAPTGFGAVTQVRF